MGCARLTAAAAAGLGGDKVGDEHRCRAGQRKSGAAKSWDIALDGGWCGTWQDEKGPGDGAEEEAVHEAAPAHVWNEPDGRHPAGGG